MVGISLEIDPLAFFHLAPALAVERAGFLRRAVQPQTVPEHQRRFGRISGVIGIQGHKMCIFFSYGIRESHLGGIVRTVFLPPHETERGGGRRSVDIYPAPFSYFPPPDT